MLPTFRSTPSIGGVEFGPLFIIMMDSWLTFIKDLTITLKEKHLVPNTTTRGATATTDFHVYDLREKSDK